MVKKANKFYFVTLQIETNLVNKKSSQLIDYT